MTKLNSHMNLVKVKLRFTTVKIDTTNELYTTLMRNLQIPICTYITHLPITLSLVIQKAPLDIGLINISSSILKKCLSKYILVQFY